MAAMDEDVRDAIAAHGIRNALLTSIAPTGTISLYAGNVSSGIEPVFAPSYTRKVLQPDGSHMTEEVVDYAVARWRKRFGDRPLPDHFVTAQDLSPSEHVRMQAAAQRWVDASISKTINCPADIGFDDFADVYMQAWETGCKGCTTYRPNPVTGEVLAVADTAPADPPDPVAADTPLERPQVVEGRTYKIKWPTGAPAGNHALYITINDMVTDGQRRPFEMFINSKNMEHFAWVAGLTRMISAVFRRGGDVSFVAEELKAIFDPRGGAFMGGRYVPSILAAIGDVLERHMIETGFIDGPEVVEAMDTSAGAATPADAPLLAPFCPACNQPGLIRAEGCEKCPNCGYSHC